jgi:hypothetical protein
MTDSSPETPSGIALSVDGWAIVLAVGVALAVWAGLPAVPW